MQNTCIHCGNDCSNKYCSNQCQLTFQYKKYILEWKSGLKDGKKGKLQTSGYIHRYIFEKQEGKCADCGIDSWCNKPIKLELDHTDGNSDNNAEENLRCLCPNCHSQTPTYRAKNKGNGRKLRNMPS
jgi:Zn finger protein HypA/HybF involved in hydrogenase expression